LEQAELRTLMAPHWRIMHYLAADAIVILDVFRKKTVATPAVTQSVRSAWLRSSE
jgi:phage-related protein